MKLIATLSLKGCEMNLPNLSMALPGFVLVQSQDILQIYKQADVKVKTVKLVFKGKSTIDETYQVYLHDIDEAITVLDPKDKEGLTQKRLQLKSMLARIDNKLAIGAGYELAKEINYDDYLDRINAYTDYNTDRVSNQK